MTKIKTISKERIFKLLKNQFGFDEIDLISELDQSAQLVEAQKRFYKLRLKRPKKRNFFKDCYLDINIE